MRYRFAEFSDVPALAESRSKRLGETHDEQPLNVWLSSDHRVVIFDDDDGNLIGHAVYRLDGDYVELVELSVDGGEAEAAFALMRDELWRDDLRVRIAVPADQRAALEFWRRLGFRDAAVTLELT